MKPEFLFYEDCGWLHSFMKTILTLTWNSYLFEQLRVQAVMDHQNWIGIHRSSHQSRLIYEDFFI